MTIAIDIDDTITKTSEIAAENLKKFDNNYSDYHDLSEERYIEYMRLYQAKGLRNAKLMDGVKEAFEYLNNKGYKIIIITARSNKFDDTIKDLTKKYLEEHGLKYNKIIFEKDSKGRVAKQEGVDIFVDDKKTVLDDVASYGIETINISKIKSDKHKTFSNWSDIIKYIDAR